jgi:spore coat protein U-like protein
MKFSRLIAATAVASTAVLSAPAFAAPVSDSFDINANVAETCTMEGINDIELGTLSINTNAGSNALFLNGASADNAGNFWLSCNDTNRMSIVPTNGKLVNQDRSLQPGDDAGFKDTINYSVAALNYRSGLFATQPAYNSLLGPLFQNQSRGAIHRQIDMGAAVTLLGNLDARPLAGTYKDTVTVTVTII